MINWKPINSSIPTSKHIFGHETPFVSCLVWVCSPGIIRGGVTDVVRWDTKNQCWLKSDMIGKWIHEPPYVISHFCDEINQPSE